MPKQHGKPREQVSSNIPGQSFRYKWHRNLRILITWNLFTLTNYMLICQTQATNWCIKQYSLAPAQKNVWGSFTFLQYSLSHYMIGNWQLKKVERLSHAKLLIDNCNPPLEVELAGYSYFEPKVIAKSLDLSHFRGLQKMLHKILIWHKHPK